MEACAEMTGIRTLPIASQMDLSDEIQSDAPKSSLASEMAIGQASLRLLLSAHMSNLNAMRKNTTITKAKTRTATSSGETLTSFAGTTPIKAMITSVNTAKAPLMNTKRRL